MRFKFSFTNKNELIYVKNKVQINPIGSLIKVIIDTDWEDIKVHASTRLLDNEAYEEEILNDIKQKLGIIISHPAIVQILCEVKNSQELFAQLDDLITAKNTVIHIFEALVDEEQSYYEERLSQLIAADGEHGSELFAAIGDAKVLLLEERNKPIYSAAADFPYIFETDDIMTVVVQEVQFLCTCMFYIRKCALCKRFIWTQKMNKVYCDRTVAETNKTCAQIGPTKVWQNRRPRAYTIYWNYRMKLSKRAAADSSDYEYQQWLAKTEKYRDLAKNDQIPSEEMEAALKTIEYEVYNNAV